MGVKLHFPTDIKLKNSPLVEAWLEVRWNLETEKSSNIPIDSSYPFALGIFFNSVREIFKYNEELPASQAPLLMPYLIQHRFRTEKDGWPLLQLGPGVATVNFGKEYSWTSFKEKAIYFREKLLHAYQFTKLETNSIYLRYRNFYPYNHSSQSPIVFLKRLNIDIALPKNIPSNAAVTEFPNNENVLFQYKLAEPKGTGKIQVGTGVSADESLRSVEAMIWDLEVASVAQDAPDINDQAAFDKWLEDAHTVLHEWFFSLIEGSLYQEFSNQG